MRFAAELRVHRVAFCRQSVSTQDCAVQLPRCGAHRVTPCGTTPGIRAVRLSLFATCTINALCGTLPCMPARTAVLWFTIGRNQRPWMAGIVITTALPASVIVLMCAGTSPALLIPFTAVYGGANGMMTILRGTIVRDVMWTEGYGAVFRLAVEMMPSFAPSTAARSQPIISMRCGSS